jgi:hypothetical protein
MTAINFPSNPTNGQTFTAGNKTYTYNSTKQAWLTPTQASGGTGSSVTTGKSIAMAIVFGG